MRVLVLDLHNIHVIDAMKAGDEVHVEKSYFNLTDDEVYEYEGIPRVLKYIRDVGSAYDLIVIGNNLGSGIKKAEALDPSLRSRAIICWNDPPNGGSIQPYKALGYQHFVGRRYLAQYILDHPEIYTH